MASFLSSLASSRKPLIVIALVGVAIIVGLVLIYSQVNNLRQLNQEIEEEEIALEQAQSLLAQRLEHRDNAPQYRERIDELRLLLPGQPEEENVFRYFEQLAEEYDFRQLVIDLGERDPDEEQNYVRMPLSISMEGSLSGLNNFLHRLYHGERAVRVDAVNITATGETQANISISISANVFYRLEDF